MQRAVPSSSAPFVLLYGASGYSGGKIAVRAIERGLPIVLAGRDEAKLVKTAHALAAMDGMKGRAAPACRVARLDDEASLLRALEGASAVINTAGPFVRTMEPLLRAALQAGVHYLDISGEARSLERAALYSQAARERDCMVMPAIGFDVVPSDCLALHVTRRLPTPVRVALGIFGLTGFSRGSARSMAQQVGASVLVRRDGKLVLTDPGALRRTFAFDGREHPAVAVTWADVVSTWLSTGVPNIETYFEETPALQWAMAASRMAHASGTGPLWSSALERVVEGLGDTLNDRVAEGETTIVAEARGAHGELASARLRCPGPYACTALSAVAIAERVLEGDFESGFETPARVFGADFALSLPGVRREDLA